MKIRYHWEQLKINYPKGYIKKYEIKDVDYDYYVNIKVEDVVQFLMPLKLESFKEKSTAHFYLTKAIEYLTEETKVELEDLEDDPLFVEFMHDRYEDEAFEEWQASNDEQ